MTDIVGAYYGNSGRIRGAEEGSRRLRDAIIGAPGSRDGGYIDDFADSGCSGAECLEEVVAFNEKLKELVLKSLARGNKVLTIGGDHSISLGSMSASSMSAEEAGKRFGVIYIDAHGDLNTLANSPSKNLHGTSLAAFYGIGEQSMTAVNKSHPDISGLILIGTRSLDEGETSIIEKAGIRSIVASEINSAVANGNLSEILDKIDAFVTEHDLTHIHLSLDIDAVDPSEAPATGVPEKDGLRSGDVRAIINHVLDRHPVRTVDIVEYNSCLDADGSTFRLCHDIAREIIEKLN